MYEGFSGELTNAAITSTVGQVTHVLGEAKVARPTRVRATLLIEELLLRYQDSFGAQASFTCSIAKRLGTVQLRLEVEGPQLNVLDVIPLGAELDDEHDFVAVLAASELEPPSWRYRRGKNVVAIGIRVQKERPFYANPLFVAVVLAVLAHLVLSQIGGGLSQSLAEGVVQPVVSALMGALSAICGPLFSVSLISGICALGDMSTFKGMGTRAIARIMCWVTVMFAVSAGVCAFIFVGIGGQERTAFDASELFELLLSSIPTNLFKPFVEGNSPQIAMESVFIGICILALGERAASIRKLVVELCGLAFKMMYLFSRVLPLLVGLSIFMTLSATEVSSFRSIGLIVALNLLVTVIIFLGALIWVSVTLHVSPVVFVKKVWPALLICFATGSTTSAMGEFYRISSEELGVERKVIDFWVPLGHSIFAPSAIVPLVVGMYCIAAAEGVAFGPARTLALFLLVFQLSIATPPVTGGIAAIFTILLGQLNLPLDSVGILMAANVFICNPQVALLGSFVRFVEVCSFARTEHALDRTILESTKTDVRRA